MNMINVDEKTRKSCEAVTNPGTRGILKTWIIERKLTKTRVKNNVFSKIRKEFSEVFFHSRKIYISLYKQGSGLFFVLY